MLAVALKNGHSNLVLGAWGCGVFGNDPQDIATYFHEVIDIYFRNKFKRIVFAVYTNNDRLIQPFYDLFEK